MELSVRMRNVFADVAFSGADVENLVAIMLPKQFELVFSNDAFTYAE